MQSAVVAVFVILGCAIFGVAFVYAHRHGLKAGSERVRRGWEQSPSFANGEALELRVPWPDIIGHFGAAALILFIGLAMLAPPGVGFRVASIVFIVFGLIAFLSGIILFIQRRPVVLDHVGIEDRRSKIGIIPWEDIERLEFTRIRGHAYLCPRVQDSASYLAVLSPDARRQVAARSLLGYPPLAIRIDRLFPTAAELRSYLERHRPELLAEPVNDRC